MPLRQSRKTLHGWKDNLMFVKPLAAHTHLSSTVSQLFERASAKIAVFTYRSPHFCFPWRRPCDYHAICCMDGKTINACQTPRNNFNSFRVIRCFSQCVSPGDAPGPITLNVVWMEREFDAYKLSRCMFPSNYNRFWDTARYWSKIVIFFIPLAFDASVRGFPLE